MKINAAALAFAARLASLPEGTQVHLVVGRGYGSGAGVQNHALLLEVAGDRVRLGLRRWNHATESFGRIYTRTWRTAEGVYADADEARDAAHLLNLAPIRQTQDLRRNPAKYRTMLEAHQMAKDLQAELDQIDADHQAKVEATAAAERAAFAPATPAPAADADTFELYPLQEKADPQGKRHGGANPCVICGREIADHTAAAQVELDVDGNAVVPGTCPESYSIGLFPIGTECRRKLPARFIISARPRPATDADAAAHFDGLLRDAYRAGQQADAALEGYDANPHAIGSPQRDAWNSGHRDAAHARRSAVGAA